MSELVIHIHDGEKSWLVKIILHSIFSHSAKFGWHRCSFNIKEEILQLNFQGKEVCLRRRYVIGEKVVEDYLNQYFKVVEWLRPQSCLFDIQK